MLTQLLCNFLAVLNLTPDNGRVRVVIQISVAAFVAMAVLAIFVYPLTVGLPAPHQKCLSLLLLIGFAILSTTALACLLQDFGLREAKKDCLWTTGSSARLALSCTRLC